MQRRVSPSLWIGAVISGLMIVLAVFAGLLAPYPPDLTNPASILEPPSAAHWLGTDSLGRDVLSRLIYAARASLGVAFAVAFLSCGLGALLGAASALAGGWVDTAIMRAVDILLSLPGLVIALALSAVLGPSLVNLALILGLLGSPFMARVFRSEALSLSARNHVHASRLLGAGFVHRLRHHILPGLGPLFATLLTNALSGALMAASALSFIGLGAQPPLAEWGALIYEGRNNIMYEWWCSVPPGLAILLAATGFVLFGDGLRDWLDPRSAGR